MSRIARLVAAVLVAALGLTGAGVAALPAGGATYPPNPFGGQRLFVDPQSNAARDAAALSSTDPTTAAALQRIAGRSQADWYGDWIRTGDLASVVANRVSQITGAGAYPVLVAYDIPKRDCGSYSGGGATSPDAYRAWIKAFKTGIGTRRAAVILEPDALAQLGCLSASDQQVRLTLLKEAVGTLAAGGNVAVYLDAGHAGWIPAATMADRLAKAGVAGARGFSLNVSSTGWAADEIAYGRKIAPGIGWKRFVVDTSRDGLGPATTGPEPWCNPPGRALGAAPTTSTGDALVDALLWVKRPGESDGTCNGGPAAGTWWRDYAVGLAERAAA